MIAKSKKLQEELTDLTQMRDIIEAYEEIAAIRMRRVKNNVLRNREFMEGLERVLGQVEASYQGEMSRLRKSMLPRIGSKTPLKDISILPNNGKMVCVLLSANTGLYGSIIKDIFKDFISFVKNNDTDVIVVGRLGRKMYKSYEALFDKHCVYLNYSDAGFDEGSNEKLLKEILKYQSVRVFHSLFENILEQRSVVTDVTGDRTHLQSDGEKQAFISCLFEPSLEEVVKFFESQILSALFEQSIYESLLGKFASRMISLDQAVQNTTRRVKTLGFNLQKLNHKKFNINQSRVLAGIAFHNL